MSLSSHFFKHLKFSNCATTLFSFHGGVRWLPLSSRFSTFVSPKAAQQKRQQLSSWLSNNTATNCSKLPFHSGATDDSLTLPYVSVHICCPRHLSDALSESLMCFGASSTTVEVQDSHESDEEEEEEVTYKRL